MNDIRTLRGCACDQTIFILGRGPSLQDFPWHRLDGRIIIAHNDIAAYVRAFWWFVTDAVVFNRCPQGIQNSYTIIAGSRCRHAIEARNLQDRTFLVDTCYFDKPLPHGNWIHTQYTGITGCIYLAWHFRAKRAYLLGVDGYAYKNQYYNEPKAHHPNRALEKDVYKWIDNERFIAKVHMERHIPAMRLCAQWLQDH